MRWPDTERIEALQPASDVIPRRDALSLRHRLLSEGKKSNTRFDGASGTSRESESTRVAFRFSG